MEESFYSLFLLETITDAIITELIRMVTDGKEIPKMLVGGVVGGGVSVGVKPLRNSVGSIVTVGTCAEYFLILRQSM